ncbi:MAG: enoyl-CoA hydratase/isomerase family protein [Roseovarius sp.]|nr:enoyl-CoA hydratase/isomerase family protein [Roseovarius sp.]
MSDVTIRTCGVAGRITLARPQALNAMTYNMCMAIKEAITDWAANDSVEMVIIDAEGDRAFCAGGDIQEIYERGVRGDYEYARNFWREEYSMNAMIDGYPKPYVAFMQGYVMGGGVGISCHGSHRIVCESTRIAMPECAIGLVPDVGGSHILAKAPGHMGKYAATTGARHGPADSIYAGFADTYIPAEKWSGIKESLSRSGNLALISEAAESPPKGRFGELAEAIDRHFRGETLAEILESVKSEKCGFTREVLSAFSRNSPLSMGCAIEIINRLRNHAPNIRTALELEYRFTHRSMDEGDFLEGIRAAVIDKDRSPKWSHDLEDPPNEKISGMLRPFEDPMPKF